MNLFYFLFSFLFSQNTFFLFSLMKLSEVCVLSRTSQSFLAIPLPTNNTHSSKYFLVLLITWLQTKFKFSLTSPVLFFSSFFMLLQQTVSYSKDYYSWIRKRLCSKLICPKLILHPNNFFAAVFFNPLYFFKKQNVVYKVFLICIIFSFNTAFE